LGLMSPMGPIGQLGLMSPMGPMSPMGQLGQLGLTSLTSAAMFPLSVGRELASSLICLFEMYCPQGAPTRSSTECVLPTKALAHSC